MFTKCWPIILHSRHLRITICPLASSTTRAKIVRVRRRTPMRPVSSLKDLVQCSDSANTANLPHPAPSQKVTSTPLALWELAIPSLATSQSVWASWPQLLDRIICTSKTGELHPLWQMVVVPSTVDLQKLWTGITCLDALYLRMSVTEPNLDVRWPWQSLDRWTFVFKFQEMINHKMRMRMLRLAELTNHQFANGFN